jgi:hypothetical protein
MNNFTPIQEYILLDREERRKHLDLESECMEVGGAGSSEYKGLLAHFLKTTIPTKLRTVYLCHACNNEICSNPKHLYWGTPKDNHIDRVESGNYKSFHQVMLEKYGEGYQKKIAERKKQI